MIAGLATLLLFQLLGELAVTALRLPIPGPVVGMLLLFLALLLRGRIPQALAATSQGLLGILALLFVPARTGIIAYLALLRREWLPIAVSLIGSTVLAISVTALTLKALRSVTPRQRRQRGR